MTMDTSTKMTRTIAAAAVAAMLAIGAYALGSGSSAGANAAQNISAQQPGAALNGQPPGAGARGGPPGMGTPVTGATATKVGNAALAKYPGKIEHIQKLANGSYVAHVLPTSGGEIHVLVSKAFRVTGTQQRPAGPAAGTAPRGAAPRGAAPQAAPQTSASSSTS
jgi:hypothetical protein